MLYGIDVFVHPEYRGLRLARRMYDVRKELCEQVQPARHHRRRPHPRLQAKHADTLTPREYIHRVRMKEIYDPILTFQLVQRLPRQEGPEAVPRPATRSRWSTRPCSSGTTSTTRKSRAPSTATSARCGSASSSGRCAPPRDIDAIIDQAEYFIDTVSDYHSDFILFPEFFNAPLLAQLQRADPGQGDAQAGRGHRADPGPDARVRGLLQRQHHRRQHARGGEPKRLYNVALPVPARRHGRVGPKDPRHAERARSTSACPAATRSGRSTPTAARSAS